MLVAPQRRLLLEKPATLMASGGRLYLWVTFRPSWGGVPCRIALKVNGFQGKIRLLPQLFLRAFFSFSRLRDALFTFSKSQRAKQSKLRRPCSRKARGAPGFPSPQLTRGMLPHKREGSGAPKGAGNISTPCGARPVT